jgi:hypothetical protein
MSTPLAFSPEMLLLDDFPELIGGISSIYFHGKGRGGGEKVAVSLNNIFRASGYDNALISLQDRSIIRNFKECFSHRKKAALFTSGIRDIGSIAACILTGRPFFVYLQVPLRAAVTFRDWRHALSVYIFLSVIRFSAREVIANSSVTARSVGRGVSVILPVTRASVGIRRPHRLARQGHLRPRHVYMVCRLFTERGVGSRDITALIRLAEEMERANRDLDVDQHWKLIHIGDIASRILWDLKRRCLPIEFYGYIKNWVEIIDGPLVFLSNYEGFGLAAFEAHQQGCDVYVNDAFPEELLDCCPHIERIISSTGASILEQVIHPS